jgi:hypothetical protein
MEIKLEEVDEWLDDVVAVCCGRHIAKEVRCVYFEGGCYVKMCRDCYAKDYPDFTYDELPPA